MEITGIEKENRAAVITLILGILGLLLSPFPYLLLERYAVAESLLIASAHNPIMNTAFCSSIFLSTFATVNGLGYLLNNPLQVRKKYWTVTFLETLLGSLNLFLAFVVWLVVAE